MAATGGWQVACTCAVAPTGAHHGHVPAVQRNTAVGVSAPMLFAAITLIAASPTAAAAAPASSSLMQETPLHGVEAIVDHGMMSDVIVRCAKGTAVVSFSKAQKVFCAPKGGCDGDLGRIAPLACGE